MVWLRRFAWLLTALYWAGIFTLTHIPGQVVEKMPHFWDKAEHFLAYFFLAALLGLALMLTFPSVRLIPVGVLLTGFAYGAVDELLQMLVPNRSADIHDWVADSLGVWLAVLILWVIQRAFIPRRRLEPT